MDSKQDLIHLDAAAVAVQELVNKLVELSATDNAALMARDMTGIL